jgi:hypothetical protein
MSRRYFNLNNEIVANSLDSLDALDDQKPVIVGGLAIQLNAVERKKLLRNTPDVDILVPENLEYKSFLTNIYPKVSSFLKDIDYRVQPKEGRGNNAVRVMHNQNREDEEVFFMHWTVFSPQVYENMKDYVARQLKYAKIIRYSPLRRPVKVACLEEIIPLKVQRSITFSTGGNEAIVGPVYSSLVESAKNEDWGFLASMPLLQWQCVIERLQENLIDESQINPHILGTYKLSKDIYDICLAAKVIADDPNGFDNHRYRENMRRIVDRKR